MSIYWDWITECPDKAHNEEYKIYTAGGGIITTCLV